MGDGRWAEFKDVETRICRFVESRDMTVEELSEAGFDDADDELDFELESLRKSKRKMKQRRWFQYVFTMNMMIFS